MTAKETLQAAIDAAGITVNATFVPFSQSRNKANKDPSLNWRVAVMRNGREFIACDYSAGSGRCPIHANKAFNAGSHARHVALVQECETGFPVLRYTDSVVRSSLPAGREPILPDACDVIYALLSDGSAIDSGTFEDWASEYGYDTDSRKAEDVYRACLGIGLKMRAALGDTVLQTLRDAVQDY